MKKPKHERQSSPIWITVTDEKFKGEDGNEYNKLEFNKYPIKDEHFGHKFTEAEKADMAEGKAVSLYDCDQVEKGTLKPTGNKVPQDVWVNAPAQDLNYRRHGVTEQAANQQTTAQQAVHQQAAPQRAVSQQRIPQEVIPQRVVSQQASPRQEPPVRQSSASQTTSSATAANLQDVPAEYLGGYKLNEAQRKELAAGRPIQIKDFPEWDAIGKKHTGYQVDIELKYRGPGSKSPLSSRRISERTKRPIQGVEHKATEVQGQKEEKKTTGRRGRIPGSKNKPKDQQNILAQYKEESNGVEVQKEEKKTTGRRGRIPGSKNKPKDQQKVLAQYKEESNVVQMFTSEQRRLKH